MCGLAVISNTKEKHSHTECQKRDYTRYGWECEQDVNRTGSFKAPVLHREKADPNEHGTIIVVSLLKSGIREALSNKENEIRTYLGKEVITDDIYGTMGKAQDN